MSTYTQIIYHIVFSTKNRQNTLDHDKQEDLFKYIWGIIKNKNCHLYRINGDRDHLHIITSLHPSKWIQRKKTFPAFDGWQKGYSAFTCAVDDKKHLIQYIIDQKEHHRKLTFQEELVNLLKQAQIEFDMKYLA